ncbi:hypothetical protein [Sphingobium yanoikuyae]|uniref:hypothetical protein n=1 Tax=Sphingobium yanoikuyae TaxID=13690 RepID=UPI00289AE158|nr:hypothetical protein [Sphingobium yanoikuyae]
MEEHLGKALKNRPKHQTIILILLHNMSKFYTRQHWCNYATAQEILCSAKDLHEKGAGGWSTGPFCSSLNGE